MDSKGRLKLPKDLMGELSSNVSFPLIVNRGMDEHLMMYPGDVWEKKTKKIKQLKIGGRKKMEVIRYFYRGASKLTLDSVERVLLPKFLIDYAKLEKDVVLNCIGDQIEVWNADIYDDSITTEPEVDDNILGLVYGDVDYDEDIILD